MDEVSEEVHTVENFYGVYLLYCLNPKYLGRTYIGYTVDPNRRINQHNKGKKHGGAWKTSNRGPWTMVMIIHGFPNDIAALRFEWAWQHPHSSRRLQHISRKKANEKVYNFCIRVLSEMLKTGPWNRLPLTIRWLNQEFIKDFTLTPPLHMPLCYGPVISKKLDKPTKENLRENPKTCNTDESSLCSICFKDTNEKKIKCLNSSCDLVAHVICMSKSFLEKGEYVPVEGQCPNCRSTYLWGDLVRKYKGCYNNSNLTIDISNSSEFYSSDDNDDD